MHWWNQICFSHLLWAAKHYFLCCETYKGHKGVDVWPQSTCLISVHICGSTALCFYNRSTDYRLGLLQRVLITSKFQKWKRFLILLPVFTVMKCDPKYCQLPPSLAYSNCLPFHSPANTQRANSDRHADICMTIGRQPLHHLWINTFEIFRTNENGQVEPPTAGLLCICLAVFLLALCFIICCMMLIHSHFFLSGGCGPFLSSCS